MTPSRNSATPHRPSVPNAHWLEGETARRAGRPRTAVPHDYPGSRWEWEAGWDYADTMFCENRGIAQAGHVSRAADVLRNEGRERTPGR